MDASMARPTSGNSRKGIIKVMRIITDPLWRERRAAGDRILSPFRTRLKDAVGIHHSATGEGRQGKPLRCGFRDVQKRAGGQVRHYTRSEEHTSELQSLRHLVCRLLLEKKKK